VGAPTHSSPTESQAPASRRCSSTSPNGVGVDSFRVLRTDLRNVFPKAGVTRRELASSISADRRRHSGRSAELPVWRATWCRCPSPGGSPTHRRLPGPLRRCVISYGVMIQRSEETPGRSIIHRITRLFCTAETVAVTVPVGLTPSLWLNSPPQLPPVKSMSAMGR
jgi:hypothetical protein